MTSIGDRFKLPRHFEMALVTAASGSPRKGTALADMVRHQFLARVFASRTEPWVLKGGTAMLVRVQDARATRDVDLMRGQGNLEEAIDALRRACVVNLDDWLTFEVQTPRALVNRQPNVDGIAINIATTLGVKALNPLKVDLVVGSLMTAEPEYRDTPPPHRIDGLDLDVPMRLYPASDHVADKVCATAELHRGNRSSRVRDLVDIVVLARTTVFDRASLRAAIHGEWAHRDLPGAPVFEPPPQWVKTYSRSAQNVSSLGAMRDFETASRFAQRFLSPVLGRDESAMKWDTTGWSSEAD